ncbi:MAG: B12-binding domain-containing radical SAM protein [Mesorhizobium sp.]|nr:MAG: B12-binding domain-containing radical SAM protein [Mesorhizobium sp.]
MKILLTSISIEFPLATYGLAAELQGNSQLLACQVEMIDLDWARLSHYERKNSEIWRYLAKIDAVKPDIICFSIYLWNNLAYRELAAITRRLFPVIKIVAGGPELATPEAAEPWLASRDVDVVVRGEGERTLGEVVLRMAEKDSPRGIPGTSFLGGGLVVHEKPGAPIRALDELASPFLSGTVPIELFDRSGASLARYPRVLLETYRGCYMKCAYCQWGNGSNTRFAFPIDRLHRELSWLLLHNVGAIFIIDAMFGYKKQGAIELLEYIVQEKKRLGASTKFNVYHNQDFFDDRLFDLYREADVYVEIDLQSTNPDVLEQLGRGRWKTHSFERHLAAIRDKNIPTTGAADLIIGIPGDNLKSFEESVNYLLDRHMRVNLYQASILPDTDWARRAGDRKMVHSPLPPRAIFESGGFPLSDMIAARLIGHGTDFFNSFPHTATLLSKGWFERPVDLCRALGALVFRNHDLMYGESHQYEGVMQTYLSSLPDTIRALCPDERKAEILVELASFEGILAALKWRRGGIVLSPVCGWHVEADQWLAQTPLYRREGVTEMEFRFAVGQLAMDYDRLSDPALLDSVAEWRHTVLFFNDSQPRHFMIDTGFTAPLLHRLNGYYTVAEALANLAVPLPDMAPVWTILSLLSEAGLIVPGHPGTRIGHSSPKAGGVPVLAASV